MKCTAADFRLKIDRSKRVRKDYLDDKKLFLDLYTNKGSTGHKRMNKDMMQVNYIYSHIRLVSPTIFAGNPRIAVKPKHQTDPAASVYAQNLQELVHYWAKELGAAAEFSSALFDGFFGLAAIETGWEYKTEQSEEEQPVLDEMGMPALGPDGMPIMQMVPVEKVVKDQPFIRWRDSNDILLDIDVPRRKDGRWIGVVDVVTHDAFMKMNEIPIEIREKVKPTVRPEDMNRSLDGYPNKVKDTSSDMEWVELEWIWCKENMMRYLMTPSLANEFLLETPWPYDIEVEDDPYPVTFLDSITDNRIPYSYSEFRPAMEHIRELNRLRTNMTAHVKANQPKYGYNKSALTRAQAAKWSNAKVDELIEMNNPEGVIQMPMAVFPTETIGWNSLIENDLVKLTGLIEYEGSPQSDTATEASIMEGRAQVRKRDRSRKFEAFVSTALAKLAQLCQQFQNEQVAVKILGPAGMQWRPINKEQIQGEFDFDIEPGIMEFKNEALRKQQVLKFAELMGSNPEVNQRYLAEVIAKEFDFAPEKMLNPPGGNNKPPPEPTIGFKDIDVTQIPSHVVQAAIVMEAMRQNGIHEPQGQPGPQGPGPQGQMPMPSVNLNQNSPMGGKVDLAPVEGNQVQPMSESY